MSFLFGGSSLLTKRTSQVVSREPCRPRTAPLEGFSEDDLAAAALSADNILVRRTQPAKVTNS